jgi:sec-independent protein translocase protein TatB
VDVSFWELTVIGVVALLVVGPERLPELARTVGAWIGKARRMAYSVRSEIERELELDELRRLRREAQLPRMDDLMRGDDSAWRRAKPVDAPAAPAPPADKPGPDAG